LLCRRPVRSSFLFSLTLAAIPLLACGGATTGGAPPGGDAGTDALTTTDAPATDAPPADAGAEGAGFETTGTLLLQAFGGSSGEVAAQVPLLEPGVGAQETCEAPVNAGACQFVYCKLGGIGSPGGGYGDFGPLSATVGTTTVPITYNGFGYGTVYFPSSITLLTGGTMTFRGGGSGGVPAFDVAATIPGLPVLTYPVPATTDGGTTILGTSQDLTVTWVPIAIGQIHFGLSGGTEYGNGGTGGTSVNVTCTFDGSSGSGVVSQSLLSSLKEASAASPIYAVLTSELDATLVVNGLTIETQSFQQSPTTGRDFEVTLE
jgi:hypothetical protein